MALHGELATDYLSLRAADAQIASLTATVQAYQRSLTIATNRYNAGIAPHTDVFQGQSQLASAQSDLEGEKRTRAQFEDAIAVLVGENPAAFTLASLGHDVGACDARCARGYALDAAGAAPRHRIGRAAGRRGQCPDRCGACGLLPDHRLVGQWRLQQRLAVRAILSSALLWSLGAQVSETLLDFGARTARVVQARAAYEGAVANYRQVTLTAFQDVQDNLVATQVLARQEALLRTASVAADKSEVSIRDQYRAGIIVYTDVVTAQATALSARRALIQAELDRQNAAVALIQALGGGWQQTDITNGAETKRAAEVRASQQP